jgi:hypothetical protein
MASRHCLHTTGDGHEKTPFCSPGRCRRGGLRRVDGDPLTNIRLIEDPAKNFVLIMKDGKVFKNTLRR